MTRLIATLLSLLLLTMGCSSDSEDVGGAGGSAGADDGNSPSSSESSTGCLDTRTPLSSDEATSLGFTAGNVLQLVEGSHEAILTWPDASTTEVTFTVDSALPYFVESVPDPDFELDIGIGCANHLQVDTSAAFVTADGRLDQRWSQLVFRADSASLASAVDSVETEDLGGNYAPEIGDNQCLMMLQFNMTLEPAGFSGNLLDTIALASCDSIGDFTGLTERSAGSWEPRQ
jgi:hypothetical protein